MWSCLVNYSWGDKWDERQRKEDERRLYGPTGEGGSSGGYGGGRGYTSYPRGGHKGRNIAIVLVTLLAVGGIVYILNPLDVKGTLSNSDKPEKSADTVLTYVSEVSEQELIKERITLAAESYRTYTFKPASAVHTYIVGDIGLQYGDSIKLDFMDGNGRCIECGKALAGKSAINFTAQGGNEYSLKFDNSHNDIASLVNIQLQVQYKDPLYEIQTSKIEVRHSDFEPNTVPTENVGEQEDITHVSPNDSPHVLEDSLQDYREYALLLINQDREQAGLEPVKLSDNEAAQVHAEDILETNVLSHWMSNGMKPYMVYTQYGGLGNVGQNAAWAGYTDSQTAGCNTPWIICDVTDVKEAIKSAEYRMMYEDASSNWGHRDNILDPHHTHVSIGIAADKYSFAMIQNFEDNYLEFDRPVTTDDRHVTLSGTILSEGDIYGVSIYYDDPPTIDTYEEHKDDASYDLGLNVAAVAPPPYYYDETINISPTSWSVNRNSFNIQFDLQPAIKAYNQGIYTVVVWLDQDEDTFPVTSYSIVVDDSPQTEGETVDEQEEAESQMQPEDNNESSTENNSPTESEDVLKVMYAEPERYGLSPVENNYFTSINEEPVKDTNSGYIVDIIGQIQDKTLTPWMMTVYYDGQPNPQTYERNKYSEFYSPGDYIACVTPRAISWYCPDENGDPLPEAEMDTWGTSDSKASQTITIRGSIDRLIDEPGVYTLVLFLVTETDANSFYSCTNNNDYDTDSCDIDSFPVLTLNIVQMQ